MKVLVVGGLDGQVARALAALAAPDFRVEVRGPPGTDLTVERTLSEAVSVARPDVVICSGALTAVDLAETQEDLAFAVNGTGPGALARICARRGVPMIHLSTDYVFDGAKPSPYLEEDPACPVNVYGRSKLAGEQAVLAASGRAVVVRLTWVHDALGRNFVRTMLRLAGVRERIGVVNDQFGRPTYAPHVARGLKSIAARLAEDDAAPVGVFHMTNQGPFISWCDFAEAVFAGARARGGPTALVDPIATSSYPTPAERPANSMLDCTKIRAAYGVELPDWREGLAQSLDLIAAGGWRVG